MYTCSSWLFVRYEASRQPQSEARRGRRRSHAAFSLITVGPAALSLRFMRAGFLTRSSLHAVRVTEVIARCSFAVPSLLSAAGLGSLDSCAPVWQSWAPASGLCLCWPLLSSSTVRITWDFIHDLKKLHENRLSVTVMLFMLCVMLQCLQCFYHFVLFMLLYCVLGQYCGTFVVSLPW